jgi:glycyl-tRNA synthetase beta chain
MPNVEDLLVEIGVEELPARFVRPALEQLKANAVSGLSEARLESRRVLGFATPRRLALIVEGLSSRQRHDTSVLTGPPVKVAFDADGAPTKAAEGFARRAGVPVEALTTVRTSSGEYLRAEVHDEGRPAVEVLPGAIVSWIGALSFQKNMIWNEVGFRFARPIRWLLAILGGRPVDLEIAGLRSGVCTRGHRFLAGEIEVPSASRYVDLLRDAGVVVDQDERRGIIEEGLRREADRLGGRVVEDERLLEEVTFLVELPTVVAGSFDPSHTSMPRDVVVTAMREHQRYFAVEREDGSLLPNFITVLNTAPRAVAESIKGNERVLEARLADARFYWDLDLSKSFDGLMEGLKGVGWHTDFGTLFDKSKRLAVLASSAAERWCPEGSASTERAALLCKADLASDMVKDGKEFTGLQGAIGGEYALRWGEAPEVAQAIREHYLPRFAGDALPESIAGAAVSLADRVDNIVGGFGAGKAPTGSEDPYALRRAANGAIRILLERELHISMSELFRQACGLMAGYMGGRSETVLSDVLQFWVGRGDAYFAEREIPYDIADAVLSVSFDDPVDSWKRCRALVRFRPDESFPALVIGFKRAANILRKEEEGIGLELRSDALCHEAERDLLDAVERASVLVDGALAATDYESAIETQLGLRPAIDRFFDDVLVMDEDPKVRATRLALLRRVHSLFLKTWDLSKIALET